jgi:hypothetical protein
MKPCNEVIKETLSLTDMMLSLSDRGDLLREDDGCGILYGVLRDAAYKIRKMAESEKETHIKKGRWK